MTLELLADNLCFDGRQQRYKHHSNILDCDMTFSIFLPPGATSSDVPVLYWLSGLTCSDENFVQKAGAQRAAASYGVAIVAPDTSPRGDHVPDDPDGAYDFGLGAGFYVDATQAPWSHNYQMSTYITHDLPIVIEQNFPIDAQRQGIFGHSMGGHGALTIALKNPGRFKAVSAFAPICSPLNCPWGEKALGGYLGADRAVWRAYDACALIEDGAPLPPMKIDQGSADDFLAQQLHPHLLQSACDARGHKIELQMQTGYDHSYFFIASFIDEHIAFHTAYLNG